ncbi:hypothetical protein, partial [Hahella ganghwensis]|uniref:hypothetical protein n=1 Tax=Hahella ganghwensis TaxID=286420 RepID=UPI0004782C13
IQNGRKNTLNIRPYIVESLNYLRTLGLFRLSLAQGRGERLRHQQSDDAYRRKHLAEETWRELDVWLKVKTST